MKSLMRSGGAHRRRADRRHWPYRLLIVVLAFARPAGAADTATPPARTNAVPTVTTPFARQPQTEAERRANAIAEEGFFHARIGDHERAIASFRQALQVDPSNRRALFGLGTSLIATEQYAEATNVLARSIELDPGDYFAVNNLAWLHATARDIRFRDGRRALAHAQQALVMAPLDYRVWSTLAESYYVSGEYARARRAAEEALRLARLANIASNVVAEYEAQLRRCRAAEQAMNILE
ncbi:MAG: tetratricopeptide repeat protein [Kiritimatiellae bacterium]|nr:tetratricopeptide repeat protein [Kiritimatiellia bacterium]